MNLRSLYLGKMLDQSIIKTSLMRLVANKEVLQKAQQNTESILLRDFIRCRKMEK